MPVLLKHFYMTEVVYAWELMYDFEMPVLGVLCSLLGGDRNVWFGSSLDSLLPVIEGS